MTPLKLFPTIPDELEAMDSRLALRYQNIFMKNTLIRGLNTVHEVAPQINPSHPLFQAFMEYAEIVGDMVRLHLEGDEVFFITFNGSGRSLFDILGEECNPNDFKIGDQLKALRQVINRWQEDQSTYVPATLQEHIQHLNSTLSTKFWDQINKVKSEYLVSVVSDERLRTMIQDNVIWLVTHSDMTILLPFILSHHDSKTSAHWPSVTEEGMAAMPELLKVHEGCWKFAPFDPITKQQMAPPL
ncbi:hypothetical protein BDQ12DRAFT_18561 [Crucibulum laeve]|uniref:Hemerythrin-like domain-containing protein n=1 Tax=Crucibulum laeve TaxID=68775 RepID=A0A5C3MGE5_9AGAR|nr:hypothetical protein BDQ12DRAFT_18561 [Crucibulum laeve]